MRLYIDTNIYLDFLLERGEARDYAWRLFLETASCKHTIIFSGHVGTELARYTKPDSSIPLFSLIEKKIEHIETHEQDRERANKLPTHFDDALHIALAIRANADCIVTRNSHDFKGIFDIKTPEEIGK